MSLNTISVLQYLSAKYPNTIWALLLNKWTVFWWSIQSYWNNFGPIGKRWGYQRWWDEFETRLDRDWFPKFANWLSIKIDIVHKVCIWVTNVSFSQNDPIIGESFWQKFSLVTLIFFELGMLILIFCQFANFGNQSLS